MLEEHTHKDDKVCQIIENDDMTWNCKGYNDALAHKCVSIEKVICFTPKDTTCRHCCNKESENNYSCVKYYKNKILHRISECYSKNIDAMIK